MESVTHTIRRGLPWVLAPLALATAIRVALEPGYVGLELAAWCGLLVLYGFVQWRLTSPGAGPWRLRASLLVNFAAINVGYLALGWFLGSREGWRADDVVYAVETAVFHGDPQRWITALQTPWLSTAAMLGYLGFGGFLLWLFLSEAFVLRAETGRLQLGLMRLYGLGFSGYLLLPAAGPCFHHPERLPAIVHSSFSAALHPWVLGNCTRVDVCPSIHTAVCVFALAWAAGRRRAWLVLLAPAGAALLLGTVYFQYHYALDLFFGALLGLAAAAASLSHEPPHSVSESRGDELLELRR